MTATAVALGITGCAAPAPDPTADNVIRVVASTNVYGDLAASVAGADVEVTSVITDASQDPHEFEANARVQLALSRADIVIVNGGGYDDFMSTMLAASGNDDAVVVNAVEASQHDSGADQFNEHVWFDYDAMIALTSVIGQALAEVDESGKSLYLENSVELSGRLRELGRTADDAAIEVAGAGAIITEPVPLYLLDRMGFENLTPFEFSEAIEQDSDVPPALLRDVLELISDGSVAIVVSNAQTGGPQTDAVIAAAAEHRVPAIGVTEILPEGTSYIDWQSSIQQAILAGLGG